MRTFFVLFLAIVGVLSADSNLEKMAQEVLSIADIQINGDRPWDIQVHNPKLYQRILKDGSLGLGEAYVEGWWDAKAVDQFFFKIIYSKLQDRLKPTWALRWAVFKAKFLNLQDKKGSMAVIDQHYQIGDDLFEKMLDPLMTYSCGYWKRASSLAEAQMAKYDLIAKKLGFQKGMRVLDIGCGWGGFAKHVAENYGVVVVGVTLSENQANYAREITKGLPVEIRVQDYRDVNETFDRIVEIGMFEHVGVKNYRTFMETVYRNLKDDGLFMLHTIGQNESKVFLEEWIDKYIFPNSPVPSIAQIGKSIEGLFVMEDWHNFSADYDKTLMSWFNNFDQNWATLKDSYPESFYRMWKYYLHFVAGTFRARNHQLWQVVLSKKGVLGGYESIR